MLEGDVLESRIDNGPRYLGTVCDAVLSQNTQATKKDNRHTAPQRTEPRAQPAAPPRRA